jgi:hypothetical protein
MKSHMRIRTLQILILIELASGSLGAQQQNQSANARSAPEYPGFLHVDTQRRRAVTVGSGPSFATEIHVDFVEKLPAAMACTEVLSRAQWRQDILLATVPKAHFDNCQFEATTAYVQQELDQALVAAGKHEREEVLSAMGRALHAIQDFYSHSDYVERAAAKYPSLGEIPLLKIWTPDGQKDLIGQVRGGLISGHVWWEPGNICAVPIKSHSELNKDTPGSLSGKEIIPKWGLSRFQAALDLAQRASLEFMRDTFAKSQMEGVAGQCQSIIGYLLELDNRKDDRK